MYNKPKMDISNAPKYFLKRHTPFYFLKPLFASPRKQFSKPLVRLGRNERAQSLAEFVIALPLLVVFVTLTHQVWATIDVHKALDDTAREAARFASLQTPPMSNITPLVQNYVANTLIPNSSLKVYDPSKISVDIQRLGTGVTNPEDTQPKGAVNSGDILQVSISLVANQAGGFYSYLIGPDTTAIVRSAAYTQANIETGVAEPTPTPAPTDSECCIITCGRLCCAEWGPCINLNV